MDKPNLFQKFYSAINAVRHKISQQAGIQYKKVASIDEIKNEHTLDYHDLSALDLREHKDLFMYAPTELKFLEYWGDKLPNKCCFIVSSF